MNDLAAIPARREILEILGELSGMYTEMRTGQSLCLFADLAVKAS